MPPSAALAPAAHGLSDESDGLSDITCLKRIIQLTAWSISKENTAGHDMGSSAPSR